MNNFDEADINIPIELQRTNRNKKKYCKYGHLRVAENLDKQNHCKTCKKLKWHSKERVDVRATKRQWFKELKKGPCADCKNSYPSYVMDFDHRPGEGKRFELRRHMGYQAADILAEIKKCDLLCANCHRMRTFSAARRELHGAKGL